MYGVYENFAVFFTAVVHWNYTIFKYKLDRKILDIFTTICLSLKCTGVQFVNMEKA